MSGDSSLIWMILSFNTNLSIGCTLQYGCLGHSNANLTLLTCNWPYIHVCSQCLPEGSNVLSYIYRLSKRKEEVKNLLAELEDRRQKAKGQVHACLVGMKVCIVLVCFTVILILIVYIFKS